MLEIKRADDIQVEHEGFCLASACGQSDLVDGKEGIHCGEGGALVAVNEWVVLRQTFPESGGFLNQIGIIAGLRSKNGRFERAAISHPGRVGWPWSHTAHYQVEGAPGPSLLGTGEVGETE